MCAITSVGRFTRAMHCAMVKVLPEPVDAEQDLRLVATVQPLDELVDGAGLVAPQLEVRDQLELVVLGCHLWEVQERPVMRAVISDRTTGHGRAVASGRGRSRTAPTSGSGFQVLNSEF